MYFNYYIIIIFLNRYDKHLSVVITTNNSIINTYN